LVISWLALRRETGQAPTCCGGGSEQARSQIVLGDSLKYNMTAGHNRRRVRYYNPHGFLGDLFPTFKGDKSISLSLV
jgi:hypothetical protein